MMQIANSYPLLGLSWQEYDLSQIVEHEYEHFFKYFCTDDLGLISSHICQYYTIHHEHWSVESVASVQVKAPTLEQAKRERSQPRLRTKLLEPRDMSIELLSSLHYIVLTRLNPLDPVAPFKAYRHLIDSLIFDILLKCQHSLLLEICHIVPAIEDSSVLFCGFIASNRSLPFRYEVVGTHWRHIHCMLHVIARVI